MAPRSPFLWKAKPNSAAMHAAMAFRGKRLGDMACPKYAADIERLRKFVAGKRTDQIKGLYTRYDKRTAPVGTFREF